MINLITLKNSWVHLLNGATVSLEIAFFSLLLSIIGGTLLALILLYASRPLRIIGHTYATIIRGTPMLVQIITLFYLLPSIGIIIPAFWAATLAIGFNSIAYVSEIIRAGIQSVSIGQQEAALALGFSRSQIVRYIVLPQAIKNVFPALGNECIILIKDSSLASVIGVMELTHQGSIIMYQTYDALTTYAGVSITYLIMTTTITGILHIIEQRLNYAKH